ncbi:MAG: LysR family transcriptional regulator [Bacilli bacterium]
MNNINLNLLKYFYEVVNTGNITKTSEKLLISQPAITKAIKELENELNTTLLERNKKGVIPTEEGKILYEHAKKMFEDLNQTINIIENNNAKSGHLYVGTTTTNFINLLMNPIKEFKKLFPNVQIHIEFQNINTLYEMSRLGHLDILVKNDYEVIENFINIKTFSITDKLVVSRKHFKELEEKTYTIKELLNYPFVLLTNNSTGRKLFDNYLKQNNIEFKPTYEFNSHSICHELIKEGFGIGIGNPIHYKNKDFIIIDTDFELPTRTFNIGYIKTSKNKYINEFISIIKN